MAKETTNKLPLPDEVLINKIYLIRNQKVMLDRDLAELFGTIPIRLREQVKRNKERFPKNFMFKLNEKETEIMVSQNAIPSKQHLGGSLPAHANVPLVCNKISKWIKHGTCAKQSTRLSSN